jgi:hypothetical protein
MKMFRRMIFIPILSILCLLLIIELIIYAPIVWVLFGSDDEDYHPKTIKLIELNEKKNFS